MAVDRLLLNYDGDLAQHRQELADRHNLHVVVESDLALASTSGDDINVNRPYMLWDGDISRWYVVAKYKWTTHAADYWYYDGKCGSWNTACDVGGPDGFGLRFNRNVVNRWAGVTFCPRDDLSNDLPQFSGCSTPNNPEENSSQGVTWRKQDRLFYNFFPDYNMHSGQIMMQIDPIACGVTLQMFSKYGHSWGGTGLSSFSVSLSAFSLSWSNSEKHWSAASQSGTWQRC